MPSEHPIRDDYEPLWGTMDKTCPWCGCPVKDLWEFEDEDDIHELDCPECDREIQLTVRHSVTYEMHRLGEENAK